MFDYKEAREFTKRNINGKVGNILGYAILYSIMRGIVLGFVDSIGGLLGFFLSALAAGVIAPLQVGLFRIVTNIVNNKEVNAGMLFDDYKNFANIFVIGFICNLLISLGYKILVVGFILDYIYIGILYLYMYNSNLSLGDFINKAQQKISLIFPNCIILELSYKWPLFVAAIVYVALAIISILISLAVNFSNIENMINNGELLKMLPSLIPFVVVTIIFVVVFLILLFRIIPRLLFAEARFYSGFAYEQPVNGQPNNQMNNGQQNNQMSNGQPNNQVNNGQPNNQVNNVQQNNQMNNVQPNTNTQFCSNCGSKVSGQFCENCGTKIKNNY